MNTHRPLAGAPGGDVLIPCSHALQALPWPALSGCLSSPCTASRGRSLAATDSLSPAGTTFGGMGGDQYQCAGGRDWLRIHAGIMH